MRWEDIEMLAEIQVIVVCLIDLSGGIDSLKDGLRKWLGLKGEISIKPFDCSLCMFHWTALIVFLCLGRLTLLNYAVICLLALATTATRYLIETILDALIWLFGRGWIKN